MLHVFLMTVFMTSADEASDERANASRMVGLAETTGNPVTLATALSWHATAAMTFGDFTDSIQAIDRLHVLADSFALPTLQSTAAMHQVALAMAQGDLSTLEREADILLGLSTRLPPALATYGGSLFELRWAQGRLDEFLAMFSDAITELRSYAGFRPALVMACLEAGDLDQARSVFAEDAGDGFESFPRDAIWLACMALFAEAAITLADTGAAQALYDLLSPYGDLHAASGPIYYGLTDRVIGNLAGFLGRKAEAETRLRHALDVHRGLGADYWAARTAVDLAELLLELDSGSGERMEVSPLLDEASHKAEAGGYGAVSRRVAELSIGGA